MNNSLFGTALILAGGLSSRMGFDKRLIKIDGVSMINHAICELSEHFKEIIVADNTFGYEFHGDCRVIHVKDIIQNGGPLSGVHCGLSKASSEFVYIIACDMPNINMEYIFYMENLIKGLSTGVSACVTRYGDWIEPFNSFYSKNLIEMLEKAILSGRRQIYKLLEKTDCVYIDEAKARIYSEDWSMFENLNTREELGFFRNRVL